MRGISRFGGEINHEGRELLGQIQSAMWEVRGTLQHLAEAEAELAAQPDVYADAFHEFRLANIDSLEASDQELDFDAWLQTIPEELRLGTASYYLSFRERNELAAPLYNQDDYITLKGLRARITVLRPGVTYRVPAKQEDRRPLPVGKVIKGTPMMAQISPVSGGSLFLRRWRHFGIMNGLISPADHEPNVGLVLV